LTESNYVNQKALEPKVWKFIYLDWVKSIESEILLKIYQ